VERLLRGAGAMATGVMKLAGRPTAVASRQGEDPGTGVMPAPDVIPAYRDVSRAMWRALPSALKKVAGVEEMRSFLTGQPVPTMDPRIRDFIYTALPLFEIANRIIPTPEKLQNPRYTGSLTSTMGGVRIDP